MIPKEVLEEIKGRALEALSELRDPYFGVNNNHLLTPENMIALIMKLEELNKDLEDYKEATAKNFESAEKWKSLYLDERCEREIEDEYLTAELNKVNIENEKIRVCLNDCITSMRGQILGHFENVRQLDGSIKREYIKNHTGVTLDKARECLASLEKKE